MSSGCDGGEHGDLPRITLPPIRVDDRDSGRSWRGTARAATSPPSGWTTSSWETVASTAASQLSGLRLLSSSTSSTGTQRSKLSSGKVRGVVKGTPRSRPSLGKERGVKTRTLRSWPSSEQVKEVVTGTQKSRYFLEKGRGLSIGTERPRQSQGR